MTAVLVFFLGGDDQLHRLQRLESPLIGERKHNGHPTGAVVLNRDVVLQFELVLRLPEGKALAPGPIRRPETYRGDKYRGGQTQRSHPHFASSSPLRFRRLHTQS